jgi:hypothetical protein
MLPFGLLSATSAPRVLRDARDMLSGFTFVVAAIALALSAAPLRRRVRVVQVLVALPTGALAIVTGGDDLPVLAMMLLGFVLAQRRQPVLSGLAMGLAGSLKFTAWPVLLVLALAERDRLGRRAILRYSLSVLAVAGPILGIGIILDPGAFFLNVVRFPLGLARVKSPAASPLLGAVLTKVFPHFKAELTFLLLALGLVVVAWYYLRTRPQTPAEVARFCGLALLLAMVIAPATRFGYAIYPANLLVWSYLLDGAPSLIGRRRAEAGERAGPDVALAGPPQPLSSTSKMRRAMRLVGDSLAPPPRAGVMEGSTVLTTAPTSQ